MAKARSPQYPIIGLKEAVDKVRAVYERDYQNALPRAVVAEHMGYQGLNGKSLGVLSALSKFGLLEGRGDETRVSALAVQIIAHPSGTTERGKALAEAASNPDLFKELDGRFGGKVSDQALRSYLLTQKFIPSAADAAIRAYRETKAFAEAEAGGYDSATDDDDTHFDMNAPPAPLPTSVAVSQPLPAPTADPFRLAFSPSGGLEGGFRLNSAQELDDLVQALTGMKFIFKRASDVRPPTAADDDDHGL